MGRMSLDRHSAMIREVKKLQLQGKIGPDGTLTSPAEHIKKMDDLADKMAASYNDLLLLSADNYGEMLYREHVFLVRTSDSHKCTYIHKLIS